MMYRDFFLTFSD